MMVGKVVTGVRSAVHGLSVATVLGRHSSRPLQFSGASSRTRAHGPSSATVCTGVLRPSAESRRPLTHSARVHPALEGPDRAVTRVPIWHSVEEVPADLGATAVSIGNYDGVHRGHRFVLDQLRRHAEARSLAPVALTFWPHPRHVMGDPAQTPLLTGHEDRDRLLLLAGMHGVLDLEFTVPFAQHSPEDFVRRFLVEGLGAKCVVLGEDALFGRANAGDITTMRELGERYGFEVVTVDDLGPQGAGSGRISSSTARRDLLEGEVRAANLALGRLHTVTDVVHHGFQRGRELGFPTANLGPAPAGLIPADISPSPSRIPLTWASSPSPELPPPSPSAPIPPSRRAALRGALSRRTSTEPMTWISTGTPCAWSSSTSSVPRSSSILPRHWSSRW